ncbi:putative 4-oxalocrotonate tautomerase [Gordonia polyisoprenivorans NBRC 16320 = JCM 10675]|uniref:4-oxalocrotonate tautomerase n=1 Tax=Gordonia polyisoprenivorans TaxID=84595 RepID=A0A846WSE2_9ACTN|nr:tautomerase family protein [Gordonia polyisoprenivorans]NKY04524.1 4-oxalocrotonate tautomerase [Gordonia polyisoprenivorans]WCB37033.1 tautomerase family protein [Gordonia polyisoprenivorans]GAB23274.1 putative 4-oxalocrotonate tautomerase [Gordonia polyisoprenivorans NBRC 16320 = JCM 10675]
MPLIEVSIAEGRTPDQLRALMHELHAAAVRTVDALPRNVHIIVRQVPRDLWASNDVSIAERDSADPTTAPTEQ